jgi:hypothetical protein
MHGHGDVDQQPGNALGARGSRERSLIGKIRTGIRQQFDGVHGQGFIDIVHQRGKNFAIVGIG